MMNYAGFKMNMPVKLIDVKTGETRPGTICYSSGQRLIAVDGQGNRYMFTRHGTNLSGVRMEKA